MTPQVGIILGSASDEPLAQKAASVLKDFGVEFEVTVASAHRTPVDAQRYAQNAARRGLKALIAVAGLSAALPGVLASHTLLPVLGVPASGGALTGLDALYAIAQMPSGVPVGCLGIDGASNAALLAVRIVALSDRDVAARLVEYRDKNAQKTRDSRAKLSGLPLAPDDAFQE